MNKLKFLTMSIVIVVAAVFAGPRLMTAQAAPPANDDFSNAVVITALPFTDYTDTRDATVAANDPSPCGYPPYNTVWYSYTPAQSGDIQVSAAGSGYAVAVEVFTGDINTGLVPLACTGYSSSVAFPVSAGTTYFIVAAGIPGGYPYPYPIGNYGGDLQLNVSEAGPVNDDFDNAKLIDALPYSDSEDTTYATWASDDPSECHSSGSVWYAFTPTSNLFIEVNTYGSSFDTTLGAFTGTRGALSLVQGACNDDYNGLQSLIRFQAMANTTYYILAGRCCGSGGNGGGNLVLNVQGFTPPANDNFADAMLVTSIPFSATVNNLYATTEPGEPGPGCFWEGMSRTLWYAYTPSVGESITFQRSGLWNTFMAVYTGSSLGSLTQLRCGGYEYNHFTLRLEPGVTYYVQLGSAYNASAELTLNLSVALPPNADFWWSPGDPNKFDSVQFCDNSYDPGGQPLTTFGWNFGDGVAEEGPNSCVAHQYSADGDFSVWYKAQTDDGRTGEITKTVSVRTHDVAITKFSVPQSASAGQTRPVVVGVRNTNYAENVTVDLYKSTANGFVWVGSLNQSVPVRPSNRTTDFKFSYTFTSEDGLLGKVTFKAVAILNGAREALPADNEAIALPTKVTGKK